MDSVNSNNMLSLTTDLCGYFAGIVNVETEPFFVRLVQELPFCIQCYPSGSTHNGWVVPQRWQVLKALIRCDGKVVFDGKDNPLGVASYSRSFQGEHDLEELKPHLVTNPALPKAYVWHSLWLYRPWAADWAFSMPYEVYETLRPGKFQIDLLTSYEPGEMLVATYEKKGDSERTIVFNAHTCHPYMANDDFAGVAVLIRLFQWLKNQSTFYTYQLVLGPEHLGTVFTLRDRTPEELQHLVGGAFLDMPGTDNAIKITSSFLGDQAVDSAFRHAARHHCREFQFVPWRQGAGNDETVWEAPGYEVPFVELSRCRDLLNPYPEYHTNLDTPDIMSEAQLDEFLDVLMNAVIILERNARVYRNFNGLICLSNPQYNLYMERPDPAMNKNLADDSEKWGYLLDCLLRYMDGSMTILDIAEKHDLPFDQVYSYLLKFKEKGLVRLEFIPIERVSISKVKSEESL